MGLTRSTFSKLRWFWLPEPAARSGWSLRLLIRARWGTPGSPPAPTRRGGWRRTGCRACCWCSWAPPCTTIPAQRLQLSVCSIVPIGGAIVLVVGRHRRGCLGAPLLGRGRRLLSVPQSFVHTTLHRAERCHVFSTLISKQPTKGEQKASFRSKKVDHSEVCGSYQTFSTGLL